ncbi:ribosomal-processing cysteine protease Prp [Clostridium sporogenes]|uniref:ribosomal-processing cysteine protease Prp n=1 Tax=Clostridium sporogenes TaxID=1509 RepID=UPI0013D6C390|nr:ribosomal-processing cysteine protease Prp [Clostridium sporogenes]EJE7233562.1 ribosomal-processing cysteine protease Prp [Clostridium botulinum]NFE81003.1 ribosomal-processing cysteine protease Prp [Clostridium sporogenes]NFG68568.1 ribosomal-processing cysteine protease Prp [Clostridium sporogenes]
MVNVVFKKENNDIVLVKMSGHAESTDQGYDMVCSAISAISITIANGITEVLKINPLIKKEDGFLSIDLRSCIKEDIHKCQVLMNTMLLGFKSIEFNYGEYIKLTMEEV